MKKNILVKVLIVLSMFLAVSCSTTMPVAVSKASIGTKRGVSKTNVLFGIYSNKNFGIKEAADNGGIKGAIATIDQKVTEFIVFRKIEISVTAAK